MGSDASAAEKEKDKEALADSLRLKTLVLDVPESLTKLIDLRRQFKEVRSSVRSAMSRLP